MTRVLSIPVLGCGRARVERQLEVIVDQRTIDVVVHDDPDGGVSEPDILDVGTGRALTQVDANEV